MNLKHSLLALTLASTLSLSGCVIHVGNSQASGGRDASSVLGDISVSSHQHAGDISTVNGNVDISEYGMAEDISVVNGDVNLDQHVTLDTIDIVNGNVTAGTYFTARKIDTVNGDISISPNSQIHDLVESVNGDMTIDGSSVGGVMTVNGDIHLAGASTVTGDVTFKRPNSRWNWSDSDDKPSLHIDADVTILGRIVLERPVDLTLENPEHYALVIEQFGIQ